jgi:hypothetical protein
MTRRALRALGLASALAFALGASTASGAAHAVRAAHAVPAVRAAAAVPPVRAAAARGVTTTAAAVPETIQIGPITAHHGFALYVDEQGCGSADPFFQVTYREGTAPDLLSHSYTGLTARCSISASGVTLRADLPGLINIAAEVVATGRALPHPGLPIGCGAPFGPELPGAATGRIDVAIHRQVFGRLNSNQASAQIFPGAPQQCPAVQSTSRRELTADIGADILDAAQPAHQSPELAIYDSNGDSPAPGLIGTLELQLGGDRAYTLISPAGSARIGAVAPFASGSLSFTALAACPGASAVNTSVAGTYTVDDPVLGSVVLRGADASLAYTGIGDAQAGGCNGPGSEPLEPELISNCGIEDGSCSVQGQTSTVTFSDETDPGTQTIRSEQVNFGDGSPVVALAPGGAVNHTYDEPGTYTATLAVTDTAGTTSTASTVVDIAP